MIRPLQFPARLAGILWVLFLLVTLAPAAKAHDSVLQRNGSKTASSSVTLREALMQLKKQYNVDILFEEKLLEGVTVSPDYLNGKRSLDHNLAKILQPAGLQFRQVRKGTYVIFAPKTDARTSAQDAPSTPVFNPADLPEGPKPLAHASQSPESLTKAGQDRTLSGLVRSETGEGLPGVSVVVKNTTTGTSTDAEGKFKLLVPDGATTLVFSFVGYVPQEVTIDSRTTLEVSLKVDDRALQEVVVVGYGTQKKINLTGAVATVDSKTLQNRAVGNLSEALQGEAPGLQVVKTGGQPGKNAISMQIRGNSTFTSNPVLTIIDGVPSSIDRINPNDIESISILKDAASTAIYGARAAGGVILITTKTGKDGRIQINYDSYVGFQQATRLPKKVTALQHATLFREAQKNDNPNTTVFQYSEADLARFSSPDWRDHDRYDAILRNALQTQHSIGISGGTAKQNFFLSVGYLKQEGIVINTDYSRFTTQYNQNIQLSDKLKLGFRGSFIPSVTIAPSEANYPSGPARGLGNLLSWGLYRRGNQLPIWTSKGDWATVEGVANVIGLASEEGGQQELKSNRASGNFSLDYDLTKHLKISAMYGINYTQSRQRDYSTRMKFYNPDAPDVVGVDVNQNSLLIQNSSETFQSAKFLINYNRTIGSHQFSVLGGYTREENVAGNESVGRRNFLTDNIYTIGAGSTDPTTWTTGGTMSDWALSSFIGRATYSYQDKYLAEASMRYDGSSRFVRNARWGFFPSVSAGWRISEENFLKNNRVVTDLKLRASWGQVGNQNVGAYPFASTLTSTNYYFNGLPQRAVYISGAPNPELSWETKTAVNVGLDGGLFNNLISFTLDVFKERTRDILLTVPLPTTFGQTAPVQNAGIVANQGWELQVSHRNTIRNFKYSVSFQTSNASEKVVNMAGTGPWINGNTITAEGYRINEWYGWRAEGLFQTAEEVKAHSFQNPQTSPGDIRYQENGGDPKTITPDDRVRLGRSDPRFPYGIRINLSYKNVDLLAFGQGVMSHLVFNNGWTSYNFDRAQSTIFDYHLDRWTPETPNGRYPKTRIGGVNRQFSSFWLENAAYFRLKNIQLGYNLPASVLQRLKMTRARFYVSGENLLTITKLKGFDPEVTTGTAERLVETRYPLAKVYNVGLNLSF
ncbi:SusC/RagA family TonB-linked outer membrane protein [Larkinella bovis]|uniref:SusC/RagA family TonB-linked outer membrane protein n=1 Tax=Larkinella bovis TaxID=683041 RepID=A0ABW0IE60_9BACT